MGSEILTPNIKFSLKPYSRARRWNMPISAFFRTMYAKEGLKYRLLVIYPD
jgi:hypothetical protein